MNTSWLIIFATFGEATETIRALEATQTASDRYSFAGGEVLLCGMGLENAGRVASTAPTTGYRWLNIGLAGSLDPSVPVGTSRLVGRVAVLQEDVPEDLLTIDPNEDAFLYSSPTPVYTAPHVDACNAFVDMEGHAIARAARARNVPLIIRKIVSDHCSETSHADILANIDKLSAAMAKEVLTLVS